MRAPVPLLAAFAVLSLAGFALSLAVHVASILKVDTSAYAWWLVPALVLIGAPLVVLLKREDGPAIRITGLLGWVLLLLFANVAVSFALSFLIDGSGTWSLRIGRRSSTFGPDPSSIDPVQAALESAEFYRGASSVLMLMYFILFCLYARFNRPRHW